MKDRTEPISTPAPIGTRFGPMRARLQQRYDYWFGAPSRSGVVVRQGGERIRWQLHHAERKGTPLQFMNGLGCSCNFWNPYVSRLHDERPCLLWDYPSHGLSDESRSQHLNIEDLARDANAVAEAAEIQDRILVGHSMGVQVSFEVAATSPNIQGIAACFGAPGRPLGPPTGIRARTALAVGAAMRNSPISPNVLLDRIAHIPGLRLIAGTIRMVDSKAMSEEDLSAYLDHIRQLDPVIFGQLLASTVHHDRSDDIATLDCPVWIVAGEYDSLTVPSLAADIKESAKNAQWHLLRKGTHAALVEKPEWIFQRLHPWLLSVDGARTA